MATTVSGDAQFTNFKPARPPAVAIRVGGDVAEIWREGDLLGILYHWTVHGSNGSWEGIANKYRISRAIGGAEVEFHLHIRSLQGSVTLIARGHVIDELVADGEPHREPVVTLKGTSLEVA